jgi:hypothetical protein
MSRSANYVVVMLHAGNSFGNEFIRNFPLSNYCKIGIVFMFYLLEKISVKCLKMYFVDAVKFQSNGFTLRK